MSTTISSATRFKTLLQVAQQRASDGGAKVTAEELKAALDSFEWSDSAVTRAEVVAAKTELKVTKSQGHLSASAGVVANEWFAKHGAGEPGGLSYERTRNEIQTLADFFRYRPQSQSGAVFTADEAQGLTKVVGERPSAAQVAQVQRLVSSLDGDRPNRAAQMVLSDWLDQHVIAGPKEPLASALAPIVDGLLWPSESDRTIVPVDLGEAPHARASIEKAIRTAAREPASVAAEVRDFETEMNRLATAADPSDPDSVASAEAFGSLRDVLASQLTDLKVIRVGEVDIDVYVLGKDTSGRWVGVMSSVVET